MFDCGNRPFVHKTERDIFHFCNSTAFKGRPTNVATILKNSSRRGYIHVNLSKILRSLSGRVKRRKKDFEHH